MGRLQPWRRLLRWGAGIGVAGLLAIAPAQAREAAPAVGTVPLERLPEQAKAVYRAIFAGGPFSDEKDGSVFGNREKILPGERRGYYHEYTVATPGARNRGARRIICGGLVPTSPAACFYTGDHYASFNRITP